MTSASRNGVASFALAFVAASRPAVSASASCAPESPRMVTRETPARSVVSTGLVKVLAETNVLGLQPLDLGARGRLHGRGDCGLVGQTIGARRAAAAMASWMRA